MSDDFLTAQEAAEEMGVHDAAALEAWDAWRAGR